MQQQTKFSKQREAIRTFLMSRTDHPTAEAVYENVKKEYPHISLGTVYRNLSLLVENGQAIKLSGIDEQDHFDGSIKPHYHFVCHKCHAIIDMPLINLAELDNIAQKSFDGTIDSHSLMFYGTCKACNQNELINN